MKLDGSTQAVLILGTTIVLAALIHADVTATRADERHERELAERRRRMSVAEAAAWVRSGANVRRTVVRLVMKLLE